MRETSCQRRGGGAARDLEYVSEAAGPTDLCSEDSAELKLLTEAQQAARQNWCEELSYCLNLVDGDRSACQLAGDILLV